MPRVYELHNTSAGHRNLGSGSGSAKERWNSVSAGATSIRNAGYAVRPDPAAPKDVDQKRSSKDQRKKR